MKSKIKIASYRQRLRLADQVNLELEVEDAEVAWAFLGPMGYEIKVARISDRFYWVIGCVGGVHRAAALSKLSLGKRFYKIGGSIEGKCFCRRANLVVVGIFYSLRTGATKVQSVCRNCDTKHIEENGRWPKSEEQWRH